MRCALYARYSSDLQSKRSIDDQLELCRTYARAQGLVVVGEHTDAAISGASMAGRLGLDRLLREADDRRIDAVLVECADRIARDAGDLHNIHKRLSYAGVKLLEVHGGELSRLMIRIKGIISENYLTDLAAKTKRGQVGRVRAGAIPGGKSYGYDLVPGDERGRRMINDQRIAQAPERHPVE